MLVTNKYPFQRLSIFTYFSLFFPHFLSSLFPANYYSAFPPPPSGTAPSFLPSSRSLPLPCPTPASRSRTWHLVSHNTFDLTMPEVPPEVPARISRISCCVDGMRSVLVQPYSRPFANHCFISCSLSLLFSSFASTKSPFIFMFPFSVFIFTNTI